MNEDLLRLIDAAKTHPSIFKKEYTFTKEQSDNINQLISDVENNNYENSKKKGDALENLMDNIFKVHNIYKIKKNLKTKTNEIDLHLELDFFGNKVNDIIEKNCLVDEVLVECKNYNTKLGVSWIGKFASLIRVSKIKMGFFVSKKGITGRGSWDGSKGLIRKLALRDDYLILDFVLEDFINLEGKTLFELINKKKAKYTFRCRDRFFDSTP